MAQAPADGTSVWSCGMARALQVPVILFAGHDELAFLVAFVSGDVAMDGPLACQVLRCERRRGKQEGQILREVSSS
jgi:hypothetical protein